MNGFFPRLRQAIRWLAARTLIGGVRCYQWLLRPPLHLLLGPMCRFTPTCSEYFIQAVQLYGPWLGAWRGVKRLLRCHPFCRGGHDPP
ncbi:MAG: membrane protein insertion efficiency factor YidD [Planctomycetota bacterium]